MKVVPTPREEKLEPRIKETLEKVEEMEKGPLLTRDAILEKLEIPKNSSNLVIVRSNPRGSGFLRT